MSVDAEQGRLGSLLELAGVGAADDAGGVDVLLLGDFLAVLADAAGTRRRLTEQELHRCHERGTAAASAGVPLRAVVDLYLSAAWRLWEGLPAVLGLDDDAAAVGAAALAVLRGADDGVAALAEGFQLARNDLSRRQEAERRDLLEALLSGRTAVDVVTRAADMGLDLSSPHAVLLVRHARTFDVAAMAAVPRHVEQSLVGRYGDTLPLVTVRAGELVVVAAVPDPTALVEVLDRVTAVLDGAGRVPSGRRPWQLAHGAARSGAAGVRASYQQAAEALDLARTAGIDRAVLDAASLAVYRVLLRDREAADELVATALTPLLGARGGARPLLETLEAYYGAGGVVAETARRLHLSVRAVTYRLDRISSLLGVDPTEPAERFRLHAAVLAARLLGWPQD